MNGPEQSAKRGDLPSDAEDDGFAKRARKNHSNLVTRTRRSQIKKKRTSSKRSSDQQIVGITHRRQRRWSW